MKPTIVPFVKWVGGKRQLIKELKNVFSKLEPYNEYHEPFVGGGAVFAKLLSEGDRVATINDLNAELINAYNVVKNDHQNLIKWLDKFESAHSRLLFHHIRSLDRENDFASRDKTFRAARFIYLNKSSYNGVYRVNQKNQFNVPIGALGEINTYSKENIELFSKALQKSDVKIFNGDYHYILDFAKSGDLVYFDPPYDSFEDVENFVGYQATGFTKNDQIELKKLCDKLINKGVNVVISNHNTSFIKELYSNGEYYIREVVLASRSINSNSDKRKKSEIEVIIYGFGKGKNE